MAKRRILILTDAQWGVISSAFKTYGEDGDGLGFDAAERRQVKHMESIERQAKGEYSASERAAIFEEATRLLKRPTA